MTDFNLPYAKDEQLPSFEKVIKGFEELETYDLKSFELEELKKVFFDKLITVPQLIQFGENYNSKFYRASAFNENERPVNNLSSFSYPSKEYCTGYGRVNIPSKPVFYSSISADTAIRECQIGNRSLERGDVVYLSCWSFKENITFNYSLFLFGQNINLGKELLDLNESIREKLKHRASVYSKDKQDGFEYLMEKISKYFIEDDESSNYKIASFIGHQILYDGREKSSMNADAIAYPSIKSKLNNINFAIHPQLVDDKMKLDFIQKIKISSVEEEGTKFNLLELGLSNSEGLIKWHKLVVNHDDISLGIKSIIIKSEKEIPLDINCKILYEEKEYNFKSFRNRLFELFNSKIFEFLNKDLEITTLEDLLKPREKDFNINFHKDFPVVIVNNDLLEIHIITMKIDYKLSLIDL